MKADSIAKDKGNKKVTPTSLAFEWRKRVKSHEASNVYITTTHLGQLKHFIMSTGSQAQEAMYFAIDNWNKFYFKVLNLKDPKYRTWFPDITFMCSHSDILLLCINEKDSPSMQVTKQSYSFNKPLLPEEPIEQKATKEDVQAALAQIAEILRKKDKNS